MIDYLRRLSGNFTETLVSQTARPVNYSLENDQSDQEDFIDRDVGTIHPGLLRKCVKQLKDPYQPMIVYSNYRKSFNRTLKKIYQEQVSFFVVLRLVDIVSLFRSNNVTI